MAHFQLFEKVYFNGCALLLVVVVVVQEQQERQFHRQHVTLDAHGSNLLPEIEIKAPEAFRASERGRYYPDLGAILGMKKTHYGVEY